MKKIFTLLSFLSLSALVFGQNKSSIFGKAESSEGNPIHNAIIYVDQVKLPTSTSTDGSFFINSLPVGEHIITIYDPVLKTSSTQTVVLGEEENKEITTILYKPDESKHVKDIEAISVVGASKTPIGLDNITRIPVNPRDMPQNISIIPEQIIKAQGASDITGIVQNVPGVILFGTYGGTSESMAIRGYRGTPIYKNGVQVDSDFRSASILTDNEGIESVQVLKGSAALTQGIGNGLGSPGGVINIVTKVPQFENKGNAGIKTGSWGLFRPFFDYQTVLDEKQTVAIRLNGAYQRKDGFKPTVNNNRIYINPSLLWRPDEKTRITLEMDYMNDNTTPDVGTINIDTDDKNGLYNVPHNKFLGWATDNTNTKTTTYSAKIVRNLDNKLSLRALYIGSENKVDDIGMSYSKYINKKVIGANGKLQNIRENLAPGEIKRSLGRSQSDDKNNVIQVDLIGKEIYTGIIKHTFQTGFDYKWNNKTSISYASDSIDIINVLGPINNFLPNGKAGSNLKQTKTTVTTSGVYGFMAQDVIEITQYARAMVGLRFSQNEKRINEKAANEAWDPFIGIMINPVKNISIFGNYATTTNLRSANNPMEGGGTVGSSVTKQFEAGIKSDWFNKQLAVNVDLFWINNNNLAYQTYNGTKPTGLYAKAGDLKRNGIEIEVNGKITENLTVITGYSYLTAEYRNSPSFVNGSRPMNAPHTTANGWLQYKFDQGTLQNLSLAAGIYYVGNRPVNDFKYTDDGHGSIPGLKPFNMPGYTTVNAQLGYTYQKTQLQFFLNNIFNERGYTSYYRGGYINEINPRNFGVQLSYNF